MTRLIGIHPTKWKRSKIAKNTGWIIFIVKPDFQGSPIDRRRTVRWETKPKRIAQLA